MSNKKILIKLINKQYGVQISHPPKKVSKKKIPVSTPKRVKKKLPVPTPKRVKKKLPVPTPKRVKKKLPVPTPKRVYKKKIIDCNLKISSFIMPNKLCITKTPFIIPAEVGKRIKDISILFLLLQSHISIHGLSEDTEFIYISSGTQGSVWKFKDFDGSLKILKIPNLQKFSDLFKTQYGKLHINDFNLDENDIINVFNTFSAKEFNDFKLLNNILSKIDISKEPIQIKSTTTDIRNGTLLYNKKSLYLNLVIKDYINGLTPTSKDVAQIKNILKYTGIHDLKKDNIIKKGTDFYLIDFLI